MKKHIGIIAFLTITLFAGNLFASDVTNIELLSSENATIARINVDGPIKFVHQTEVPKDGRPNRVIVDILSAVHKMGKKEFSNLPTCVVSQIRTSQYSVNPEKVVRLVFDMKNSPIYTVNSDGKAVIVTFTDQNVQPFAKWSSSGSSNVTKSEKTVLAKTDETSNSVVSKPKTVVQKNQEIDNDRIASLESTQKADKPKVSPPKANFSDSVFEPEINDQFLSKNNESSIVKDKPVKKPVVKTTPATQETAKKDVVNKNIETKSLAKSSTSVDKNVPTKDIKETTKKPSTVSVKKADPTPKKVVVPAKKSADNSAVKKNKKKSVSTDKSASKATAKKVEKTEKQKAVVANKPKKTESSKKQTANKQPAKKEPVVAKKSTSRFRRTPNKIKGTMVAQFPTRLVVKYRSRINRDPFKPLIIETIDNDGPIVSRVPNVEGLKLVGIIDSDGGANRALLEDKLGISYILKTGDKVKNGYVLRVETEKVYFQIFEYGWSRTIAMTIDEY